MPSSIRFAMLASAALALGACQTTPGQGSRGRVEVSEVLLTRAQLRGNPQVDESLEIYEKEIGEGRLVPVRCVIPDASAYRGVRDWRRFALLPSRGAAQPHDIIAIGGPEGGDPAGGVFVFRSVIPDPRSLPSQERAAPPARDLQCQFDADGVPRAVEVDMPVQAWALAYSKAERARHRQFSDQDFEAGRVGVGVCALRDVFGEVYHQPRWLFRVPPGQSIRQGDVVEIEFGEVESGGGVGVVSTMIRSLGTRAGFPNDGHAAVFCR